LLNTCDIYSPKFFRKIQYVPTLSALATFVPLTNLDLHPAVYKCESPSPMSFQTGRSQLHFAARENLKHEREIRLPHTHDNRSQMFGISLAELMGDDGLSSGIPRAVKDCVEYVRRRGIRYGLPPPLSEKINFLRHRARH
jgi:Rho GTPase-activating protein 1